MDWKGERPRGYVTKALATAVAATALGSCGASGSSETIPTPTRLATVITGASGCQPFGVYAQNRWSPQGASERLKPDVLSPKTRGYGGNEVIAVDGWYASGKEVYPTNPAPWNSDVWLHVRGRVGWVAFAAVRSEPTTFDPSSLSSDGGKPVTLTPVCRMDRP